MSGLVKCKYCGAETPEENFNCIYCGEVIFEDSGFLGRIKFGKSKLFLYIVVGVLLFSFFIWYCL